jgi:nucleoside-diphosphate-sugar epimerase
MKVLLTGGTGFIGHSLAESLLDHGHSVRCVVRDLGRASTLRERGAEIVRGNLSDRRSLDAAVAGVDTVLHLAGVVRAWTRDEYFRTNVEGTRRVCAAARAASVERFVLVSSLAAVGPAPEGGSVNEETPPRPINAYGESKLEAERLVAAEAGPLRWSIVRPCVVYGPRDRDVGALFRLVNRGWAVYAAPRGALLSVIHVDDLVDLVVRCAERSASGSVFMASDGMAYSWSEIIGAIGKALGRKARQLRLPPRLLLPVAVLSMLLRPFLNRPPLFSLDKVREAMEPAWVVSPEKARRELDWRPCRLIGDGVRSTAEWYREAGWL